MITVSSITKNTGRYAMILTAFFYIPVIFAFNLPHCVTSYMHHAGKKSRNKKKEKKFGYETFVSREFEPGPFESVRSKR